MQTSADAKWSGMSQRLALHFLGPPKLELDSISLAIEPAVARVTFFPQKDRLNSLVAAEPHWRGIERCAPPLKELQ